MKTSGSLFSGGGLADWGYREAGYTPVVAVEYKPELADVYRANFGDHITVGDVREVDFMKMERPDLLHMSPVCTRASQANTGASECELDITCAQACVRAVETWMPEVVIMENVWGYRTFESFKLICAALDRLGYWYQVHHLNSADFLVPQTRKRLFLRASRDGWLPPLPAPTRWMGWYEAIADIVDALPESEFAPWQLERLGAGLLKGMELTPNVFVGGGNKSQSFLDFAIENRPTIPGIRNQDQPMCVVPADTATNACGRAFLVSSMDCTVRDAAEPAVTMLARGDKSIPPRAGQNNPRAFIVDCQDSGSKSGLTLREGVDPMFTVTASMEPRRPARAAPPSSRLAPTRPRLQNDSQSLSQIYGLARRLPTPRPHRHRLHRAWKRRLPAHHESVVGTIYLKEPYDTHPQTNRRPTHPRHPGPLPRLRPPVGTPRRRHSPETAQTPD